MSDIFGFLKEAASLTKYAMKSANVRRMRKAVDLGERFIFLTEEIEKASTNKDEQLKTKHTKTRDIIKKRFFRFNQ